MKAEEYLKENRFESIEYAGYDVAYEDAKEAVKLVKEKAIEAFRIFVEDYAKESGMKEVLNNSDHYLEVFKKNIGG